MSSLHEYEAYLDSLDDRFRRLGSEVQVNFSRSFVIDLERCSSLEGILRETRELTIRLADDPGRVDIQYLVKRLIFFAMESGHFAGRPAARGKTQQDRIREAKELSNSIGLVGIDNVVRARSASGVNPSLRFENGTGPYAGRHFFELERTRPDAVRVNRSAGGQAGLHAEIAALDAVETDTSLFLFLPEPLSWTHDPPSKDEDWYWIRGTRVRLIHSFTDEELHVVRMDLHSLMEGLPFTYSLRKSSIGKGSQ